MGATAPLPYLEVAVSLLTFLRPVPLSGGPKSPFLNTSLPLVWKFLAKVSGSGSGHIFSQVQDPLGPAAARPVKP